MTTMRVVGECFFWYRLTRVFPDKFHRAVKRLCVCVCYYSMSLLHCAHCITLLFCNFFSFYMHFLYLYFSIYVYCYIYVWYVQINKYLLTYFRAVGLYSRALDFESMHRVQGHASTGSKASGLEDKAPWSSRIFIKQIQNSNKNKRNSVWTKNNFAMAHQLSPSVVNSRRWPSPVNYTQHPALCRVRWRLGERGNASCSPFMSAKTCKPLYYPYLVVFTHKLETTCSLWF